MDEGGERKNEIQMEAASWRRVKLQFQGIGAHPWLLGRRSGLARGTYNRLIEDARFASEQILARAQWCLDSMISAGGFPAYQMVFGSNPTDHFGWEDADEDLMFARDTSLDGQSVQPWKLRMRAEEAALKEVADIKLRRLLAYNKSFNCADINLGDSVLFYKAQNRKSLPRWRGPAKIPDIHETGATVTCRSQTSKVARYCARKQPKEKDVSDEVWRSSLHRGDTLMSQRPDDAEVAQASAVAMRKPLKVLDVGQEPGGGSVSTNMTREPSMTPPRLISVFDSPPLSVQLPPEPGVEETRKASASFDGNCAPPSSPGE